MSWSTSELRVRLAPLNRFKPSSKIFYWPFQGGTYFVDLLCFCSVLCLLCFVRVCLYVLCGHLLGKGRPLGSRLWCLLWVCHFPIGILGQVWYLIVSIPDLCNLITLYVRLTCFKVAVPFNELLVRVNDVEKLLLFLGVVYPLHLSGFCVLIDLRPCCINMTDPWGPFWDTFAFCLVFSAKSQSTVTVISRRSLNLTPLFRSKPRLGI